MVCFMFPLRHAAIRLLSSRTGSIATRPSTFRSFSSVPSKPVRTVSSIQFQRRWASNEAEAKQDEAEVPVSQLQATAEEEVENAIHEDSAAPLDTNQSVETPIAESANATEATEEATSTATESPSVAEAANTTFGSHQSSSSEAGLVPPEGIQNLGFNQRSAFREPASPKPTAYVGNLFFDVTENDLTKEFSRFGTIKRARIIKDARGLSKGFGYIQFESTEQAQKAIDEMHQQVFEGRRLMVSFATVDENSAPRTARREYTGPQNPPSKTLFIGNMSFEMTDKDLNQLFRGIRNVIDVRVAIDRRTGQPRGFAHADFVDTKSAMDAMKILSTKENYGRKLRLDYSAGPNTAPRNMPR